MSTTMAGALRRIQKELRDFNRDPPALGPGSIPAPFQSNENDEYRWTGSLMAPEGSPWAGTIFDLAIEFPPDYPLSPMTVRWLTPIFHPWISSAGEPCLAILQGGSYGQWSPALTVSKVIMALIGMLRGIHWDDWDGPCSDCLESGQRLLATHESNVTYARQLLSLASVLHSRLGAKTTCPDTDLLLELAPMIAQALLERWNDNKCHRGGELHAVMLRDNSQRGNDVSPSRYYPSMDAEWAAHRAALAAELHTLSMEASSTFQSWQEEGKLDVDFNPPPGSLSAWDCKYRFWPPSLGTIADIEAEAAATPPADLPDEPISLTLVYLTKSKRSEVTVSKRDRGARLMLIILEQEGIPPDKIRLLVRASSRTGAATTLERTSWIGHCQYCLENGSEVVVSAKGNAGGSCPGHKNRHAHDMAAVAPALFLATARAWARATAGPAPAPSAPAPALAQPLGAALARSRSA